MTDALLSPAPPSPSIETPINAPAAQAPVGPYPGVLTPKDFEFPAIMLSGAVDYNMYATFRNALSQAPQQGLVAVELSTLGGDPEVARMMGEDIRFHSDMHPERRLVFLGKTAIYSAGATFMSFFARQNRYLTRGTRLMIHERMLTKTLNVQGPLTTCIASLRATINEIEASIAIQNEGFANLVLGSTITLDDVLQRATENWYLEAQEALQMGLVEAVI
jgi:ATP-dependent protease ClpP protease subunit